MPKGETAGENLKSKQVNKNKILFYSNKRSKNFSLIVHCKHFPLLYLLLKSLANPKGM